MIGGKAIKVGTIGFVKIAATDPHSASGYLYLTIKIKESQPTRRTQVAQLPDREVIGGTYFMFLIANNIFFDQYESTPLVFFASTEEDDALDSWVKFNPLSRAFYGNAPYTETGFSIRVQVRAMN